MQLLEMFNMLTQLERSKHERFRKHASVCPSVVLEDGEQSAGDGDDPEQKPECRPQTKARSIGAGSLRSSRVLKAF